MKLLNVAPVKAGDKVASMWTAWEWVTVTGVRREDTHNESAWIVETEEEGWFYWIDDLYWKVQKNETAQCSSGQAGAEV